MTQLIHRTGDIFTSKAKAIGHGVNTEGVMGSGIAVQFRTRHSDMFVHYQAECLEGRLPGGSVFVWEETNPEFTYDYVYNISSQIRQGANADYSLLIDGVSAALEHAEKNGVPYIALPRIGSGVGGLDQDTVELLLGGLTSTSTVDIELWTYDA